MFSFVDCFPQKVSGFESVGSYGVLGVYSFISCFSRGLFQHALLSIEYLSIEVHVWRPDQDLSPRLNCPSS